MNLHEFQAKELLAQFGVPVPRGRIAGSGAEASAVARRLGFRRCVVKAQIHAGDRAANGGIRHAANPDDVGRLASELLARPLVTSQTGLTGQNVRWVYIEEEVAFERSLYCAVVIDRTSGGLLLIVRDRDESDAGEAILANTGTAIPLELSGRNVRGDYRRAAGAFGLDPQFESLLATRLAQLAEAAVALDALLLEISPLALTRDGDFVALDAKVIVDDNALFRHPDFVALQEVGEAGDADLTELAAQRHQINYMRLDGDIGVVVNGAGLALATLDLLHDAGGRPANFMDIRTTATSLDIAYAFELIATNPRVRAVLVNVHGGGMQRCDTIVDGIGIAVRRKGCNAPIVMRLAGNNAEFAAGRIRSYGIPAVEKADMWDAACTAVQLAMRKAA